MLSYTTEPISEKDIDLAENYYFKKASLEVRHFGKEGQYTKFSKEKDGKMLYTGQIPWKIFLQQQSVSQ